MRRPPASTLGDAADGAAAPPTPQASGGAPPPLAGAKKSLGGVGPSKSTSRALSPVTVVGFVDMAAEPPPHLPPEPGRSHEEQENGVAEPSTGDFTANWHEACPAPRTQA